MRLEILPSPFLDKRKLFIQIDHNDLYCFECHDEGDVICCDSCPRVYHPKCLGLTTLPDGDWTCPECKVCISNNVIRVFQYELFKDYSIII